MQKLLLALLLISIAPFAYAQKVSCTDCKFSTSVGDMDAFEILVPKCDAGDVEKAFEKYLKKHDGDVSTKKGEIKALNVLFKDFYQIPVTIYAKVEAAGADVKVKVSVVASDQAKPIPSQPELYQKFKDAVKALCVAQAKDAAQERIDAAQKQLDKLNGDMTDLKKTKDNLQKEIDDYNASIEKDKKAINNNASSQDKKATEINEQNQKLKDLQNALSGIF